ncbi:MAG: response regulator [bacterium]|nr:response regulator [bacterium]
MEEKILDISTGGASSEVSLEGKKILWIEDDEFLSSIIAQRLAKEKGVVVSGTRGEDVVGLAEHEMPDIIMLDILLPGMDGMDVLAQLKSNGKTKHIPVIMFSNFDDKTKVEQSKKLGAAGFFVKASVNLDEIVNEIRKAVSTRSA